MNTMNSSYNDSNMDISEDMELSPETKKRNYNKNYYINNRHIWKSRYEDHKYEKNQYDRKWRQSNPEYHKNYNMNNRERLNRLRREYMSNKIHFCECCNKSMRLSNKYHHEKTAKHLRILNNQ